MKAERAGWWVSAIALVAFLTWLRSLAVSEYDLFWQARAGYEILHTGHVQTVDTWSYIAQGHPWFNFEWLSCVVDYLASRLAPRYAGLYYLRALLIGSCLFMQAWMMRRPAGKGQGSRSWPGSWVALIALLPVSFTLTFSRFQMRPDLFATAFFLALLLLWLSEWPALVKKIAGLVLLVLWSNFHAGTVPFGILLYSTAILCAQDPRLGAKKRAAELLWIFGAGLAWVATPIGIHVFDVILGNVLHYDYTQTRNPDFAPFSLAMFHNDRYWIFAPWPFYTAIGAGVYAWMIAKRSDELPAPYRRWPWITAAGLILTWLAYQKLRCIQYQVFFILPVLAAWIYSCCRRSQRVAVLVGLNFSLLFCWFYFPYFVTRTVGMHVARTPEWDLPVKSVEFIKRTHPAKNLMNAYDFGGYLIAELPEYPVAWDSREIPFLKFMKTYRQAFGSGPVPFQDLLDRLSVSTVLDQYPVVVRTSSGGLIDAYALNYPKSQWALTYFDDVSVVLMRRNVVNDPIIRRNEYRFIRPGLPFDYAVRDPDLTPEERTGWETDASRCLADNPENTYCLLVKSSFAQARGELAAARSYCGEAIRTNPESRNAVLQCAAVDAAAAGGSRP